MIIPDELMPIDPETGEAVDIIFNPLGIFGRNNWGSIFELAISKIAEDIERISSLVYDGENFDLDMASQLFKRIEFIDDHFISKYDKGYSKRINQYLLPRLRSAMVHENFQPIIDFVKDIQDQGFYIFAPNFPKIPYTDFYNEFISKYGEEFGTNFKKSKVTYKPELIEWLRKKWQYKNEVFNDDVYETEIDAFIGTNYMLKLYHTSYSKFTSVSLANSYSKITGQPVRGRKKTGGQHISWQTLAALLGHKEHSGILKELYTIKSDAPIKDKEKFLMQYITHGQYRLKPKYTSLTKRAVNNALKILGMQLED
jgi:DNA-directed RNA polymerase beta subunit